jgi:hypothetical protein
MPCSAPPGRRRGFPPAACWSSALAALGAGSAARSGPGRPGRSGPSAPGVSAATGGASGQGALRLYPCKPTARDLLGQLELSDPFHREVLSCLLQLQ